MIDDQSDAEDPSPEDIERFSGETAYCPDCGAEVWDQAEVCPECYAYLGGNTSMRRPMQNWFRRKWFGLTIAALLVGMLLLMLFQG